MSTSNSEGSSQSRSDEIKSGCIGAVIFWIGGSIVANLIAMMLFSKEETITIATGLLTIAFIVIGFRIGVAQVRKKNGG